MLRPLMEPIIGRNTPSRETATYFGQMSPINFRHSFGIVFRRHIWSPSLVLLLVHIVVIAFSNRQKNFILLDPLITKNGRWYSRWKSRVSPKAANSSHGSFRGPRVELSLALDSSWFRRLNHRAMFRCRKSPCGSRISAVCWKSINDAISCARELKISIIMKWINSKKSPLVNYQQFAFFEMLNK